MKLTRKQELQLIEIGLNTLMGKLDVQPAEVETIGSGVRKGTIRGSYKKKVAKKAAKTRKPRKGGSMSNNPKWRKAMQDMWAKRKATKQQAEQPEVTSTPAADFGDTNGEANQS